MQGNLFYAMNPFLASLILLAVLIGASEAGFRIKKRRLEKHSEAVERSDIALIIGAVLTLLALLLGFTYAMSSDRYETRRQLVIKEANAIGTTYLRAKALPEPASSEIQELLRQYTALRVKIATGGHYDPGKIRELDNRTKHLHGRLWTRAAVLAREKRDPIMSVFLQTLNEMIDLHAERLAAFRNRVPSSIYLVLFAVSAASLLLAGTFFGSYGRKVRILTFMLAFLVSLVMWLIMDLDQPTRGAIRASQESLIGLNQDLSKEQ